MKKVGKSDQFIAKFVDWVTTQSHIEAVALVGSYANGTASEESDIDLILLVPDPDKLIDDIKWVYQFGVVSDNQIEHYGKVTSIRVWYSNGQEVEFGISDINWASPPLDYGTQKVIDDGMKVLFERKPLLSIYLNK